MIETINPLPSPSSEGDITRLWGNRPQLAAWPGLCRCRGYGDGIHDAPPQTPAAAPPHPTRSAAAPRSTYARLLSLSRSFSATATRTRRQGSAPRLGASSARGLSWPWNTKSQKYQSKSNGQGQSFHHVISASWLIRIGLLDPIRPDENMVRSKDGWPNRGRSIREHIITHRERKAYAIL